MIDFITSPWQGVFDSLIGKATESIVICSPYIGDAPCCKLTELIESKHRKTLSLLVLTNLSCENMLSRATDVTGLIRLYETIPNTTIRFLPNLHAKIYVVDNCAAVITSANFTQSGLSRNIEYGIKLMEERAVQRVRRDTLSYHGMGTLVDLPQLRIFETIVNELSELQKKALSSTKKSLQTQFTAKLKEADKEILRVRAASIGAHAGFAQTILFLLQRGPQDTRALYREIQAIHPDLCDDSVKLVISGEEWSQSKWKHKVRHAQLYLARQGRIIREGSLWRLNE